MTGWAIDGAVLCAGFGVDVLRTDGETMKRTCLTPDIMLPHRAIDLSKPERGGVDATSSDPIRNEESQADPEPNIGHELHADPRVDSSRSTNWG